QRRQYNPIHTLRRETFDDLDLLFTIVFTQRPFPNYFHICALSRQLAGSFVAAGVNAFPKLVRSPFWNDRDREFLSATGSSGFIGTSSNYHQRHEYRKKFSHKWFPVLSN